MGKKHTYYGKSMSNNFPGFPHTVGLTVFSHVMGNWWENKCISHLMKCATGWESNGKNHTYYEKSMSNNFPGSPPYDGLDCLFPCYGKLMGKHMHFPCDEVHHGMGIWLEKSTHIMRNVWIPIPQVLPIQWVLLHFPVLWEIDGETHAFPTWWCIP